MKHFLLAGTLVAGASAPFTLPVQEPGGALDEARARYVESVRRDSDLEQLLRERHELERQLSRLERLHEIEALEADLQKRRADRDVHRSLELKAKELEAKQRQLEMAHEQFERAAEVEVEQMYEAVEREFEAAEREYENAIDVLETALETQAEAEMRAMDRGDLDDEEFFLREEQRQMKLVAKREELEAKLHAQAAGLEDKRREVEVLWNEKRHAQERERVETLASVEEQLYALHLDMEANWEDLETQRELEDLRRALEHEDRMAELHYRLEELDLRIERAHDETTSLSDPVSVFEQSQALYAKQVELKEVFVRLDRVESEIQKLWAALENLEGRDRVDQDDQNAAANFRAGR